MPWRSNYDEFNRPSVVKQFFRAALAHLVFPLLMAAGGAVILLALPYFLTGLLEYEFEWGPLSLDDARWALIRAAIGAVIGLAFAISIMLKFRPKRRLDAPGGDQDDLLPSIHNKRTDRNRPAP